ncbi:hypothetical protein FT663_01184 [Candidozyma haemuli var. vulneris]|uniref:Uncharacterized protein n=1 Tax=Candidozyma haemuli TaxID=45357 RepID=A0A2V1AY56_9ASCO|nr:hypothetical protein CXQ85_005406 [[Candida] haemuloni]KAF3992347.1 hypothetical protein FT662_01219 [[Candida] haemuloni var. vulneris]KAF3994717.1 hypothetical protein FT663_01184 [[Candida] haemuloni var. vulneris]PVH22724.1 hypothetical protein CXQ85_005406 [[Candida] haemuloni]
MIRSNWSLQKEVRQNESKQKQKIQQRQKHQHQLEKLKSVDPIRLYFQIERLEKEKNDEKRLKSLKDDWSFIRKHKLHADKLDGFLEQQKQKKAKIEKDQRRLWGNQSVYFNPELNPLGKVPAGEDGSSLPNLTAPLRHTTKYSPDPLIRELGIALPEGEPPKFYKSPQNTKIEKKEPEKAPPKKEPKPTLRAPRNLDMDSDDGYSSSSGDEHTPKKLRVQ